MSKKSITTKCEECRYYSEIFGIGICRRFKQILKSNITGCFGGEKKGEQ